MEQVIRKIVELIVLGLAYIPMGTASIAFIATLVVVFKRIAVWIKTGAWSVPPLHESVQLDFLHYLLDDRLTGFRRTLIEFAAKIASLPSPVIFLVSGFVCLTAGLALLNFARAIKNAAQ